MDTETTNNQNDKKYYRAQFPQPYIAGYGTSLGTAVANQIDTTRAFAPVLSGLGPQNTWALTRTGVGTYTLTHNLNTLNVFPFFVCYGTSGAMRVTSQTVNSLTLALFTPPGVAVDARFSYVVWALP